MCWEETEETVIHEDNLSGELQKERHHFLLMGLTLYGEILTPDICLGRFVKKSTSPKSREQQTKDIWREMQHEYLNVYEYA